MLPQSTERLVDVSGPPEKWYSFPKQWFNQSGHAIHILAECLLSDITRAYGAILYDPVIKLGGGIASVSNKHSPRTRRSDEQGVTRLPTKEKEGDVSDEERVYKSISIPADMVGCIIGKGMVIDNRSD